MFSSEETEGETMYWGTYIAEWLHILFAITWFGSVLYITMVLTPAMQTLPPGRSGYAFEAIVKRTHHVLVPTAYATVVLGFLRGTVFGRVQSMDTLLGTRYGILWMIAFGLGTALAVFAHRVVAPRAAAMAQFVVGAAESGAPPPPPGAPPPPPALRLMRASKMLLAGFLVIFTVMVALNFS